MEKSYHAFYLFEKSFENLSILLQQKIIKEIENESSNKLLMMQILFFQKRMLIFQLGDSLIFI